MQFFDTVAVTEEPRLTSAGFLVADVRIARTGIQEYLGREVGRPMQDRVRVYRPAEEVFADRAMATIPHKPMTNDHPPEMVDATNWKRFAVGSLGDTVARDGDYLRVPMTLQDGAAIDAWRNGKRELSVGYTCQLDWTPGVTPGGETYDAVQRGIVANHLALVQAGRAGPQCRVGDSELPPPTPPSGAKQMADTALKSYVVDNLTIETNDAGLQAIRQINDAAAARLASVVATKDGEIAAAKAAHASDIAARDGALAGAKAATDAALAAKDGEIAGLRTSHGTEMGAKDGEIAALRTQIPDAAALDALLDSRFALVAQVKTVLGDAFPVAGKSMDELRRAAVSKLMGDADLTGKPAEYVSAAFDALTKAGVKAGVDPLARALADAGGAAPGAAGGAARLSGQAEVDAAQAEMNKRLTEAYRK